MVDIKSGLPLEDETAKHITHLFAKAAEYGIPDYMRNGLIQYIMTGRPVGGFLSAVLENDLVAAVHRGDDINQANLANYIKFLHNHAPNGCFGRVGVMQYWRERGGLAKIIYTTK